VGAGTRLDPLILSRTGFSRCCTGVPEEMGYDGHLRVA